MTEDTLKCKVFKIEPLAWRTQGLAVSKEVHLSTELGFRVHLIYVGYQSDGKGSYTPMLMIRLNFSWGLAGEGSYFALAIKRGDEVLALTTVERKATVPTTDLVCFDTVGVTSVMLALSTHDDLVAELHGPDGVNVDFPVPSDTSFYPLIRSVIHQVTDLQNDYN